MARFSVHAACVLISLLTILPAPSATSAQESQAALRRVFIEIDQMAGTPELPLSVRIGASDVRLEDLFRPAGVELIVRRDETNLPAVPEVTLRQLHDMMLTHSRVTAPAGVETAVRLLVAFKERGHPEELGVMFDYEDADTNRIPREGFAVFTDVHAGMPGPIEQELLLTTAHELCHVFNLHHADWEGGDGATFQKGSTIEGWSSAATVQWKLSQRSLDHLLRDPAREIWPGRQGVGFNTMLQAHYDRHQPPDTLPTYDAPMLVDGTALESARQRPRGAAASRNAPTAAAATLPGPVPATLELEPILNKLEVGSAFAVTIGVHNRSSQPFHARRLLDPAYGILRIEIQGPDGGDFVPFVPLVLREARGSQPVPVAAGDALHEEAKIFFGVGGWTAPKPGNYRIRADFPAPAVLADEAVAERRRIQSNVINLEFVAPQTSASRIASRSMSRERQGLNLLLGGDLPALKAAAQLEATEPSTLLAGVRFAVAADLLAKAETPQAIDEAVGYLARTGGAAIGPFTLAMIYDDAAKKLDQIGRTDDAVRVRQTLVRRLSSMEAGADAANRVGIK